MDKGQLPYESSEMDAYISGAIGSWTEQSRYSPERLLSDAVARGDFDEALDLIEHLQVPENTARVLLATAYNNAASSHMDVAIYCTKKVGAMLNAFAESHCVLDLYDRVKLLENGGLTVEQIIEERRQERLQRFGSDENPFASPPIFTSPDSEI